MILDCIIIGAGPAGLSAALFLARYRRNVLTLHHNNPRNIYTHGVHGFLGHDGIPPADLLELGKKEVRKYGGRIIEACAVRLSQLDSGVFEVGLKDNEIIAARRVLLATGLRDLTPDCPGFREFYGLSVHHCPDCDGYEVIDKRVAVLSQGNSTVAFTQKLLTWTNKLTLLTDGDSSDLTEKDFKELAKLNVDVREKAIARLEGDARAGQLERVLFIDDSTLECDALFFNLGTKPASDLHEMIGCRVVDGLVYVDEYQQTSVAGVYAAGDITPNSQLAIVAAAEGAMAAIQIHQSLAID